MPQPNIVAQCFDKQFSRYAAVSAYSLFSSASTELVLYWLVPASDLTFVRALADLIKVRTGKAIQLIGCDTGLFRDWRVSHHFTQSMYLRLLLPREIPHEKVIYVDADTLVLSDLSDLFSTSLDGALIGGVVDLGGASTTKIPRTLGDPYINTGVLLMDLKRLKTINFLKKVTKAYDSYKDQLVWPDQCLLNKFAEGKKRSLDPQWNRLIFCGTIDESRFKNMVSHGNSRILHFLGPVKPWHSSSIFCASEFWKGYARKLNVAGGFALGENVRRNDLCPCGSGRRYKHCHGVYD